MAEPLPAEEQAWAALFSRAMRGPPPGAMAAAIGETVSGWAAEPDMEPAGMRARAELLWDRFSTEEASLRERLADLDAPPREACRALAALGESVATLAAIAAPG